jgi:hypothetical protein
MACQEKWARVLTTTAATKLALRLVGKRCAALDAELARPWNPTLQPKGSYPDSISRWRVVEVAAPLGLPFPTARAVAVSARTGPFDLGRGPL